MNKSSVRKQSKRVTRRDYIAQNTHVRDNVGVSLVGEDGSGVVGLRIHRVSARHDPLEAILLALSDNGARLALRGEVVVQALEDVIRWGGNSDDLQGELSSRLSMGVS